MSILTAEMASDNDPFVREWEEHQEKHQTFQYRRRIATMIIAQEYHERMTHLQKKVSDWFDESIGRHGFRAAEP